MADDIYNPTEELANAITQSEEDISNSDLSEIMRERFSGTPDAQIAEPIEAPSQASEQGETVEGETSATPPPPDTTTPPEFIDLGDGQRIDRETLQSYAEFHQFLTDNPEFAEVSRRAFEDIKAAGEVESRPPTITPPEGLDLDDPTIKQLWDIIQSQDTKYNEVLQRLSSVDTTIATQTQATTESLINRGVESFKRQNGLTDDEVIRVRETAARLEVLPALMSPVDPITGLARKVDPLAAIESSLDIAMWTIPEYREKALEHRMAEHAKEEERKRKLSKLGGSSGSVPRTPPVPQTQEQRKQAMIAELANFMSPGRIDEE